jgi:membrane-bound inhibitor of C-type lysozyme
MLAGACAAPEQPEVPEQEETPTTIYREVAYACEDGGTLSVRYYPLHGVAVLVRGDETIELDQKRTGSGFKYSNGPDTIRGKGDALTVESDGKAPLQCSAR